jgi:predicted nucleic-acid-binding protein
MVTLLDTNIIIRFLTGEPHKQFEEAKRIMLQVQNLELQVEILDTVMMEVYFVMTKFYKLPNDEVINDLKVILSLEGVVNRDKAILIETLNMVQRHNIDFVDALICSKSRLQGYEVISFDKDLTKC